MTDEQKAIFRGAEEYGRILAEIPTSTPAERLRETLAFEMWIRSDRDAEIARLKSELQELRKRAGEKNE